MIAALDARDVAEAAGGTLLQAAGDVRFGSVSIDTRSLEAGALFFAIRGPNHDGHAFLEVAAKHGATGLVVDDATAAPAAPGLAVIEVADTSRALADVARFHRDRFAGPVVAITGSNGKTTTKEMCAAILERSQPCLRTRGNLNNEYGLPLTLLSRRPEDTVAVVELGMNHRGEIARLVAIARPTIGVVTNVGTAHIEFLGSREEIAREKADLLAALTKEGQAFLHGDEPLLEAERERIQAAMRTFGLGPDCDVRAAAIERTAPGRFAFDVVEHGRALRVDVAGVHEGTVPNALAAVAAARAAGASDADVTEGLARYQPAPGRMNLLALGDDRFVLDDTYNANPQSMDAALSGLSQLRGQGRAWAVLGDMGELGDAAEPAHRAAGRRAAELGIDRVAALGEYAERLVAGARDAGLPAGHAFVAADHDALVEHLLRELRPGDRILVKGSRAMRMERIVEGIASTLGAD